MEMIELNTMAKKLGHATIYFYQMLMCEVYTIQNVTVVEMKVQEGALVKQVRESNNTVNKMKKTVKEN